MTAPSGVAAVGAYAPSLRVSADELAEAWPEGGARGVEETAVPDVDEDALTMGYEAATRAFDAGGPEPGDVDRLVLATTTPPVEEEDVTPRLGAMLGIPGDADRATYTASTAAGVRALVDALEREARTLVVASDCPRGAPDDEREHAAGAGAAAALVTPDGALELVDAADHATPYPGTRFREAGSRTVEGLGVTDYDRASFVETLSGAADRLDADATADAAAVQAPDGAMPYRATDALGVDRATVEAAAVAHDLGDLGAASVPVGLARALDGGAETLLAAGYGSGATATVAVLAGGDEVPVSTDLDGDRSLSAADYLRRRGEVTSGPPEGGGAHVSVPTWRRSLAQRYRLVAGRCPDCGSLNFPPTGACSSCGALVEYDQVSLDPRGTVEAVSTISAGGAPPEFADLQTRSGGDYATGVVAFDGPDGDSASVPVFVVEADPASVAVGDRVEATIRRIYTQEGVTRYGVKVRPVEVG